MSTLAFFLSIALLSTVQAQIYGYPNDTSGLTYGARIGAGVGVALVVVVIVLIVGAVRRRKRAAQFRNTFPQTNAYDPNAPPIQLQQQQPPYQAGPNAYQPQQSYQQQEPYAPPPPIHHQPSYAPPAFPPPSASSSTYAPPPGPPPPASEVPAYDVTNVHEGK